MAVKARSQIVKDYLAFPLLSAAAAAGVTLASTRSRSQARRAGRDALRATLAADFSANVLRNVWAYMIIFCGHFPDQTYTFSEDEVQDETRGGFYVRQLLGAANIEGSPLFHVISGNLGYQVEHHLYPDMPSTRYGEIAPRVRAICEKYELPYNTGPLFKQLGTVQRTILRLAFPGGKPRPKPGPYRGARAPTARPRWLPPPSVMKLWPGSPFPLGANYDGVGTNFAIFSEAAELVELCLFDADGTETRTPLTEMAAWVWHGYAPNVGPGPALRLPGPRGARSRARRAVQSVEAAARPVRHGHRRARCAGTRRSFPTASRIPRTRSTTPTARRSCPSRS